jgi:AbrB family looped-hinge helix DNA binding protein
MFTADMATISARGQVAIPADIRRECGLKEGDKLIFMTQGDEVVIKKSGSLEKFFELTDSLRKTKKRIKGRRCC